MSRPPPSRHDSGYSLLEEILHSASHGLGAVLSLAGTVVLVALTSRAAEVSAAKLVAIGLYGTSLVLLYTASSLYHGTRHPRWKGALRVLDHCAIYVLIAGSYTPFLMVNLRDSWGGPLLALVWTLAVIGVAAKLWRPHAYDRWHLAGYLVLGWLILVAADELAATLSLSGLGLIVASGLSYSCGVVFFVLERLPFNHAAWHLCVMGGSGFHFVAVYTEVLPYPS